MGLKAMARVVQIVLFGLGRQTKSMDGLID